MIKLLAGDVRDVLPTLAADSVHCVVTSPPYYGLRDYGTALWDGGDADCQHTRPGSRVSSASTLRSDGCDHTGPYDGEKATIVGLPFRDTCGKCGAVRIDRQIGLEATPDEYLATMVAVFREVRRVMRPDATCWVNLGDSYASAPSGSFDKGGRGSGALQGGGFRSNKAHSTIGHGAKPKDLLLMPARLALALQSDGWWIRSAITWCKPSPMPESCTDRPTSATEMVYLLTKRAHYFYDSIAIREEAVSDHPSGNGYKRDPRLSHGGRGNDEQWNGIGGTRNARNWWVINSKPFPDAHFATFPPELAERCIRAGTSERGCCAACGKPWVRQTTSKLVPQYESRHGGYAARGNVNGMVDLSSSWKPGTKETTTTGWQPGCDHGAEVVPCTVLDPFAGAGTTLLVADRLQRDAIGIELNVAYTEMAMERCRADAPLFTSFPPAEDPNDARTADLFAGDAA